MLNIPPPPLFCGAGVSIILTGGWYTGAGIFGASKTGAEIYGASYCGMTGAEIGASYCGMLTGLEGTTGPDGIVAPPPPPPPKLMSPPVFPLGDGPGPDGILTPPLPPPEALTPLTADDPPPDLDPPFLQYMKQQQHPLSSKNC